jgi:dephospho-CoA kinase
MAAPVVGLTGGIASGKSTVAKMFVELGVPVVDADVVAREVVMPGSEGLREVVAAFGEDVLLADGSLDRPKLGQRVFGDPAARAKLNAITHPRIAALSAKKVADLAARGASYVIYEAPLLVENGLHHGMAATVVVAATEETQLARMGARDGFDPEVARSRIAAQLPLEKKLAVADHVIWNDGDLPALRARVAEVHGALMESLAGAER